MSVYDTILTDLPAALRSGKYKQAYHVFAEGGIDSRSDTIDYSSASAMCALGVGNCLVQERLAVPCLPLLEQQRIVSKWIGSGEQLRALIVQWNNEEKLTFDEIADKIEGYLYDRGIQQSGTVAS